jgi:hypothetical protein
MVQPVRRLKESFVAPAEIGLNLPATLPQDHVPQRPERHQPVLVNRNLSSGDSARQESPQPSRGTLHRFR